MSQISRLAKVGRVIANLDLVLRLWAYGPSRDLRHLIASQFGDRECLRLAVRNMEKLNKARLLKLANAFPHRRGDKSSSKYLCVGAHLVRAAYHTQVLNLLRAQQTPPNLYRVLDIGTGPGFFPYLVSQLGHSAVSIDIDDNPLYTQMIDLLNVDRVVHRVTLADPLPNLGERFDVITAFQLLFDQDSARPRGAWEVEDWSHFLSVLKNDYLTPGGKVYVGLNSGLDKGLEHEVTNLFMSKGGVRHQTGYLVTAP